MIFKFSLSGRQCIDGAAAVSIYAKTVESGIPACSITTMWSDKDMFGHIFISLSQISCSFEIDEASKQDMLDIQDCFMHENYQSETTEKILADEMRKLYPDCY